MDALTETEIAGILADELPGWQLKDNALQRIHTCHEYLKSLTLVYKIGQYAESVDHHPDLMLHYKRATIRYWTHRAKGVTRLDIDCAKAVEALIQSEFV